MTLAEFWPLCLQRLHQSLPAAQFDKWLAGLTVGEENGAWVIFCPTQFAMNMVKTQFAKHIEAVRAELAPAQKAFVFKVGKGESYAMPSASASTSFASKTTPAEAVQTEQKATTKTKEKQNDVVQNDQVSNTKTEPSSQTLKQKLDSLAAVRAAQENRLKAAATPSAQNHKPAEKSSDIPAADGIEQRVKDSNLLPEYTFENLVEGKGNHVAIAAAQAIVDAPGKSYNPFFLYGSTGLGKTHLVQAIAHDLLAKNPKAKVCYLHSNEYVRHLMAAFRNNMHDAFKQKYKQYDLLIVDDIQFLKSKERTMEEFFFLFNHFHDNGKQIILTCDVLPNKIEELDDRLKSRFSWGLTLELDPPEFEMRVAILQKKAEREGLNMDMDAIEYIAENIRASGRELEGALKRVSAASIIHRGKIDILRVKEALKDIIASNYKPITADGIIEGVAKAYSLKISDLTGRRRVQTIARPRQIVMCLLKELTALSYQEIGASLGNRDHSTVIHGVEKVAELRETSPEFNEEYERLLKQFQN
ncbi:MAG: chromosomal replication initiator protein DnaA [Neisseria sp.]|nr:chromosomal replication initiator protein DnaA [Neisseria sp.]